MPSLRIAIDALQAIGPLRALQAEIGKFRSDIRSVTLTTQQYTRLMTDLGRVTNIMTQQGFTAGAAALKTFQKNIEDTAKTTVAGTKEITASLEKLRAASKVLEAASATAPKYRPGVGGGTTLPHGEGLRGAVATGGLQEAIGGLDAALLGLSPKTKRIQSEWQSLVATFSNSRPVIGATRELLISLFGTVTTALAVRSIIQQYAAFEVTLANIRAATGATAAEMALLETAARKMGVTTQFSANQAAEGLLVLVRAGFTAREAITSLAPVLNLATAAQLDVGQATLYVSSILKQYQLGIGRVADVTDILLTVANKTTTDVRELAEAFKFVGPIAATAGIPIEDTAAALGVLAENGIRGTLAGTALRATIEHLASPTSKAQKTIRELDLGLSALDPSANKLVEVLEQLAYGNLKVADATAITGLRSSSNVIVLGRNVAAYKELIQAVEQGAGTTKRASDLVANTLTGSFNKLKAALNEVSLAYGEGGLGRAIRGVVDIATRAVQIFGGVHDQTVATTFGVALLTAAIKGLTISISAFVGISIIAYLLRMRDAVRLATVSWSAFSVALKANPFGIVTTGLSLVIGGISLFYDWMTKADEVTRKQMATQSLFKERLEELAAAAKGAREAAAHVSFGTDREDIKDTTSGLNSYVSSLKQFIVTLREIQKEQPEGEGVTLSSALRAQIRARQKLIQEERIRAITQGYEGFSGASAAALENRLAEEGPTRFPRDTRPRVPFESVANALAGFPELIKQVRQAEAEFDKFTDSEKRAQGDGILVADAISLVTRALGEGTSKLQEYEEAQRSERSTADADKLRTLTSEYNKLTSKIREETEALGLSDRQLMYVTKTRDLLEAAQKIGIRLTEEEIDGIRAMALEQRITTQGPVQDMLAKMYEQIDVLSKLKVAQERIDDSRKKADTAEQALGDTIQKYTEEIRFAGLADEAREEVIAKIAIEKQVRDLLGDSLRKERIARQLGVAATEVENILIDQNVGQVSRLLTQIRALREAHEAQARAQREATQAAEDADRKRQAASERAKDTEASVRRQIELLEKTGEISRKYGLSFGSAREDASKIVEFEQMLAAAQGTVVDKLDEENQARVKAYAESIKQLRVTEALYAAETRRHEASERAAQLEIGVKEKANIIPETFAVSSRYGLSYRAAREDASAILEFEKLIAEAQGTTIDKLDEKSHARVKEYADSLSYLRLIERIDRTAQDMGNAFGDAFGAFVSGAKDAKGAAEDLFRTIEASVVQELISRPIAALIASWIAQMGFNLFATGGPSGGFGGGSAFGNAFSAGHTVGTYTPTVTPFRDGGSPGLVSAATYFPMSGGRTGVMGEFTDELILPAKRTSRGELGVAVAGAGVGGMTVHQHFNIVTPDPAGVRRSMPQVLRKAAMGIRGANR